MAANLGAGDGFRSRIQSELCVHAGKEVVSAGVADPQADMIVLISSVAIIHLTAVLLVRSIRNPRWFFPASPPHSQVDFRAYTLGAQPVPPKPSVWLHLINHWRTSFRFKGKPKRWDVGLLALL
jgi:hypothetical protein